jgi:hypothetical protein
MFLAFCRSKYNYLADNAKASQLLVCTTWVHLSLSFSSLWVPRWLTIGKWIPC